MDNLKLKPCPFCGGAADFRVRLINAERGISQMKAVCMVCEVESPHGRISVSEFRNDKEYLDASKIAAWRWNIRVGDENE